jgi:hypothetical protein
LVKALAELHGLFEQFHPRFSPKSDVYCKNLLVDTIELKGINDQGMLEKNRNK